MKKFFILIFIAGFLGSCSLNPVTGRKQLSLVPESQLQVMALDQYRSFLSENKVLSPSASSAAMVDRVGA